MIKNIKKELHVKDLYPSRGFIIAETACGHEGKIDNLFQLIDVANEANASAIKFQIFIPNERTHENHSEWEIFNKLCLTESEWIKASNYAHSKNLFIFADVFGDEGLDIASKCNVDGYKIHSEDMLNIEFIKKVIKKGKIVMLGVGAIRRIELQKVLNSITLDKLPQNIILIPGVQVFPTPYEAHSLFELSDLIKKYSSECIKIGFADHVNGDLDEAISLPQKALAMGAVVLEKHITIDRNNKWEDYESALDIASFNKFINEVKKTCVLLKELKLMNKYEKKYRNMFKKMPISKCKLLKNYKIKKEDIIFQKQDLYSVPLSSNDLVGKVLKKDVNKGQIIRLNLIEQKIGAIIVVRNTSSRLPQKAIKKILGKETISLLIERIKRCKNLDEIVLATSTYPEDDVFQRIAKDNNIKFFRGSLNNVAERFYNAAKHYEIDHIVRVTGDDILRDEVMIDYGIESHLFESRDVTFIRNTPYGCASEIFSFETLRTIMEKANNPLNTEYLEHYLANDRYFSINEVFANYKINEEIRLTLDYEEDFILFKKIFEHFESIGKKYFTVEMVIQWLNSNRSLLNINNKIKPKFDSLDLDVTLNI